MSVTDPKFNPSGDPVITVIKERVLELEKFITGPSGIVAGRRRSVALTKLEDFSMWAVKAAAVGDK